MHVVILHLILTVTHGLAIHPCEYLDGSGRLTLDIDFTESYGGSDHLPTREEVRHISKINGKIRPVNGSSSETAIDNSTIVLRLWDSLDENRFWNGTGFSPLVRYINWSVWPGLLQLSLKQGIDREILDIYKPGEPGVTSADAQLLFHIECRPDSAMFPSVNYTVKVAVNDVNDNPPLFYNTSLRTNSSMKNFSISVREGTPSGVTVLSGIAARDKDQGLNAVVVAFLTSESPFFELDNSLQPEIRLRTKRSIHYEYLTGQRPGAFIELVVAAVMKDEVPLQILPAPIVVRNSVGYGIRYSLLESQHSSCFSIDDFSGNVTQIRRVENHSISVELTVKATKWTERISPYLGRASFALLIVKFQAPELLSAAPASNCSASLKAKAQLFLKTIGRSAKNCSTTATTSARRTTLAVKEGNRQVI